MSRVPRGQERVVTRLAAFLPGLLLAGLLLASTEPAPSADTGPVVQMTVTPRP